MGRPRSYEERLGTSAAGREEGGSHTAAAEFAGENRRRGRRRCRPFRPCRAIRTFRTIRPFRRRVGSTKGRTGRIRRGKKRGRGRDRRKNFAKNRNREKTRVESWNVVRRIETVEKY